MKIDKKNGNVKYNDEEHLYWDDNGKYISVTTLIGKYCQPFDKEFWSGYKALEKLLSKENFKMEKKMLLDTKKIELKYYIDMYGITENDFNREQQAVLDGWQKENEIACERGTKIHADLENMFTSKKTTDLKKFGLGGKFQVNTNQTLEDSGISLLDVENGVFPEYLIFRQSDDGILKIAGQVDLLVKEGNNIWIIDWKGLPLDTEILTSEGWSTIGQIQVGDKVFDKDGKLTTILHKSEIHNNPCYKINFTNEFNIVADSEHRWLITFSTHPNTKHKGKNIEKVMTTKELYDYMQIYNSKNQYQIPKIYINDCIEFKEKVLPIDPYLLGLWLGDGDHHCGKITQELGSKAWDELTSRGIKFSENQDKRNNKAESKNIYGLLPLLKENDLYKNKHIPDIYYTSSISQRLDLLRGLMDADGFYSTKDKTCKMSTTHKWQSDGMIKLLSSLGIKAVVTETFRSNGYKENTRYYDISFKSSKVNPFLTRNQNIELIDGKTSKYWRIKSIEKTETVPTQCIEVDSPTHTFLCTKYLLVTHNTNKKIEARSYFDSNKKQSVKMKYPLNNLDDCNLLHYTMQLSTYAWMVQKLNPEFKIAGLKIVHFDHQGNTKEYELNYLKNEVERMLKDYKKSIILEKRKNARKPIEF